MKIADTYDNPPIDQFKVEYVEQNKKKFEVSGKVQEQNHWKNTDKSHVAQFKKGWKPNLKWSQEESNFRCQGADRPMRTFDKIVDHA